MKNASVTSKATMQMQLKDSLINYCGKNIMVNVKEVGLQVSTSYLMEDFDVRVIDSVFMDGKNTISASLHFPISEITGIDNENEDIIIHLGDKTQIRLSIVESDPKIWKRAIMNRNWEKGRMYLY